MKRHKKFEEWAKEHKFLLSVDTELGIYSNPYTQGAWMAYKKGMIEGLSLAIAVVKQHDQEASKTIVQQIIFEIEDIEK